MTENAVVKKILTGLFDGADVPDYIKTPGLKFFNEETGKFQTYKEITEAGNDKARPVTFRDIRRVSIEVNGEEQFFEKVTQNEAVNTVTKTTLKDAKGNPVQDKNGNDIVVTTSPIDEVTNKTVDNKKPGIKVTSWIRTNEGGIPIDKDKNPLFVLDEKGKMIPVEGREGEAYWTFQGYKGDLVSKTSQEEAARSGERNDLYSPTSQVAAALKTAQQELERRGVKKYNAHVVAHSFGTANAMVAASLLGDKAKDVFLEEPVTASGTLETLKSKTPKELAGLLNISEEEGKKAAAEIKTLEAKVTSRRSVEFDKDGNPRLSNASLLRVFSGDPKDKANEPAIAAIHLENAGSGNKWTMLTEKFTIKDGRNVTTSEGVVVKNSPQGVDKKNDMIGKQEFEFVSPKTVRENGVVSLVAKFNPLHTLSNTVHAEQNGAPVAASIKELKAKVDALPMDAKDKVSHHGEHSVPKLVSDGLMVAGTVAHGIQEKAGNFIQQEVKLAGNLAHQVQEYGNAYVAMAKKDIKAVAEVAHHVKDTVEHKAHDVGHVAGKLMHSAQHEVQSALLAFRNSVMGGAHSNPTVKPQTIAANAKPKSDTPQV